MGATEFLYRVGDAVYSMSKTVKNIIKPRASQETPTFKYLKRVVRKDLTVHEFLSLKLQISLLVYLVINLILVILRVNIIWILVLGLLYLLYLRYFVTKYSPFFLDPAPYRLFYYGIGIISLLSFLGYGILQRMKVSVYYPLGYLIVVLGGVLLFRHYFKQKYGRDYTYGIVEEVKNDLVKVFVNDDIAANVKPGYYWLPKVPEAEPGRVVKILVKERSFRSSLPERILEVHLTESSHSSMEPKNATE